MAKRNNQQSFDGLTVELYGGRFSGNFDLDEEIASEIAFDDEVTFVVRGRVAGVAMQETKNGDLKRINVFQVSSVATLNSELTDQIVEALEEEQGIVRLPFDKGNAVSETYVTDESFQAEDDAIFRPGNEIVDRVKTTKDDALRNFLDVD